MDHGAEYLMGTDETGRGVCCISLKVDEAGVAELRRLAVIPALQGKGYGRRLVEELERECGRRAIGKITLGIVSDHVELHEWYLRAGYSDSALVSFTHLPFKVQYMQKNLVTTAHATLSAAAT